jgi:hypothetical protein
MEELLTKLAAKAGEIWNDPVWSKVMAANIVAVFGSVLAWIGTIFNW